MGTQHSSGRQRSRRWLSAIVAMTGSATIVLALIMDAVFPGKMGLDHGFTTPILAFEFARTAGDLDFLSGTTPQAIALRRAMDHGHQWDTVFPLAYGGMLFVLLLGHGLQRRWSGWAGLPVIFGTAMADLWENSALVALTAALDQNRPTDDLLAALFVATWLKWGGLAVGLACLARAELIGRHWIAAALPAVAAALVVLSWVALIWCPQLKVQAAGFTLQSGTVAELMALSLAPVYLFFTGRAWYESLPGRRPV